MKTKLSFLSFFFFIFFSSYSTTVKVPSEYPTIQAGMDAANTGDTVLVADGTYTGEGNLFLSFAGKAIVVKSENGPENCIIDCVDSTEAEVFQLINGETRESIVEGFKIINGGLIIIIENSSPTIKNNIFENDTCGVYCGENSNPLIENNIISQSYRYGIYCYKSFPVIRGNHIKDNLRLGIYCGTDSNPVIDNNIILRNEQSGIMCYNSLGIIQNNIITENVCNGIYCSVNSDPNINNNVVSKNEYPGIYCGENCNPVIENNIISQNFMSGIYCYNSEAIIKDNSITQNKQNGIYYKENSSPLIENNIISESYRSGIYCYNSGGIIRNNRIIENIWNGVYCKGNSNPLIENNIISQNNWSGIGVLNSNPIIVTNLISENIDGYGGGIRLMDSSAARIVNNVISHNVATQYGGGIYASNDASKIINNTIVYNSAAHGAGIFSSESDQIFINNIIAFSKRYAITDGPKIMPWGNRTTTFNYYSGILTGMNEYMGFINTGAAGNVTVDVPGISDTTIFVQSNETFRLNILWVVRITGYISTVKFSINSETDTLNLSSGLGAQYNGTVLKDLYTTGIEPVEPAGGIIAVQGDSSEVKYCNFYNNEGGNYFTGTSNQDSFDISSINENLIENPLFADEEFLLSGNSPCIDAGIVDTSGLGIGETDFLGNPRFFDASANRPAIIDVGALEFQDNLVGIDEYNTISQADEFGYSLMPNPNNGIFNFKINSFPPEKLTVKIINGLGQVVGIKNIEYPTVNQIEPFDASHLNKGIYYFIVTSNLYQSSKKILIQ